MHETQKRFGREMKKQGVIGKKTTAKQFMDLCKKHGKDPMDVLDQILLIGNPSYHRCEYNYPHAY